MGCRVIYRAVIGGTAKAVYLEVERENYTVGAKNVTTETRDTGTASPPSAWPKEQQIQNNRNDFFVTFAPYLRRVPQDPRHLAQLPPPDPRFDTRVQGEQRGGADLRGGADGSYFPGQQGLGGQQVSPVGGRDALGQLLGWLLFVLRDEHASTVLIVVVVAFVDANINSPPKSSLACGHKSDAFKNEVSC